MKVNASKNVPDWFPSEDDYVLVFCEVQGYWRECSNNVPKFNHMLLADYLSSLGLCIPDYTQFIRILNPEYHFEYKSFGGRVTIYYNKTEEY